MHHPTARRVAIAVALAALALGCAPDAPAEQNGPPSPDAPEPDAPEPDDPPNPPDDPPVALDHTATVQIFDDTDTPFEVYFVNQDGSLGEHHTIPQEGGSVEGAFWGTGNVYIRYQKDVGSDFVITIANPGVQDGEFLGFGYEQEPITQLGTFTFSFQPPYPSQSVLMLTPCANINYSAGATSGQVIMDSSCGAAQNDAVFINRDRVTVQPFFSPGSANVAVTQPWKGFESYQLLLTGIPSDVQKLEYRAAQRSDHGTWVHSANIDNGIIDYVTPTFGIANVSRTRPPIADTMWALITFDRADLQIQQQVVLPLSATSFQSLAPYAHASPLVKDFQFNRTTKTFTWSQAPGEFTYRRLFLGYTETADRTHFLYVYPPATDSGTTKLIGVPAAIVDALPAGAANGASIYLERDDGDEGYATSTYGGVVVL